MRARPSSQRIQNYNLFGEEGDLPDVVHCETIEARSVLHDWELTEHRHARLHQILLVENGGGRARLEDQVHPLGPLRIVNVPMGCVHGFSFVPGTQGWVVTLAAEIMSEVLAPREGLPRILARPTLAQATAPMRTTVTQIFAEFAERHFARAQVLRALTGLLLGLVARELTDESEAGKNHRQHELLHRFEALLEAHFAEQWSVADYAAALAVTPTHLSRICRTVSGQSASRVILERLIREARRNLIYTNLPISSISYALGFEDPAYFSRVFAGATGLSPRAFRQRIARE